MVVSRCAGEERLISSRGRRTLYLAALTASTWPVYGGILRYSSAQRDTTFFIRAARCDVLRPCAEIRHSLSARRDITLFRSAIEM